MRLNWILMLCVGVLCLMTSGMVSGMVSGVAHGAEALLADAVERQDVKAVRALLSQNEAVNAAQADGMTALHWAAYLDELGMAKMLIEAGAEVEAQNRYGVSPLSLACGNGATKMVQLLLKKGANANGSLATGETVLMTAARTGRLGAVKALLAKGAEVDAQEKRGQTAMMWAAAEGHAAVVDALLEAGGDFVAPLASGYTPFMFAVRQGNVEVVRALLKAGADVNKAMAPTKAAAKGPKSGMTPLLLAIENSHFELAVELIYAGADANDQRTGYTPLQTLTWIRKPSRGDNDAGNPSAMGSGNLTSLQFVRELVRLGGDVNAAKKSGGGGKGKISKRGATAFIMAAETGDVDLMRVLIEVGADPSIATRDDTTALMLAAGAGAGSSADEAALEHESLEAVKFLVELGADVNAVDRNGETAMHGAGYKGMPSVVAYLDEQGAEVAIWNQKNKWGWTPLLIAQGFRPGNFKPSYPTVAAIEKAMVGQGVTPPPAPERVNGGEYRDKSK